jgi:hypothetical protein
VRNRVHHQWALALEPLDVIWPSVVTNRVGGSRVISPPIVLDWHWVPVPDLPPPDSSHPDTKGKRAEQKEAYADHLADRPARLALRDFAAFLERSQS